MRGVCAGSQRRSQSSRHKEKLFCEHCNETLSKSQFCRNKRLYFNEASKTWGDGPATANYSMPDPFSSVIRLKMKL